VSGNLACGERPTLSGFKKMHASSPQVAPTSSRATWGYHVLPFQVNLTNTILDETSTDIGELNDIVRRYH
ncbi:MAG: hypothetical protein ABIS36_03345, partial [Chryseolinea sp.]